MQLVVPEERIGRRRIRTVAAVDAAVMAEARGVGGCRAIEVGSGVVVDVEDLKGGRR